MKKKRENCKSPFGLFIFPSSSSCVGPPRGNFFLKNQEEKRFDACACLLPSPWKENGRTGLSP
jgi:hypothetical protein